MIKTSDDIAKRIEEFYERRQTRLDSRRDGGTGSGNWNHVGRPHKRGGSAPAGTLGNFGKRGKGKYYKVGEKSPKGHYTPDLSRVIGQVNSTTGKIQNNTATMWTNENGDVHEKRMEIYDDAIDEAFRGKKPAGDKKKKVFTVIGGAAGSGKRNLQDTLPGLGNSVALGANRMAQLIGNAQDRYEGGNTSKAQARSKAANHFSREGNQIHEEASALSKAALREAFEGGYNITYDTAVSSIDSTREKLREARDRGYELRGEFINAPLQQCIDRERLRWESAKKNYMRDGKLDTAYPPEMPNFETMIRDYAFSVDSTVLTATEYDTFNLYDNTSTGGKYSDMRVKMAELAVDADGKKCLKLTDEAYRDKLQHFLDQGDGAYTIDKDGFVRVVRTPEEQAKNPVEKGKKDIVYAPTYPKPNPGPKKPPKPPKAPKPPEPPKPATGVSVSKEGMIVPTKKVEPKNDAETIQKAFKSAAEAKNAQELADALATVGIEIRAEAARLDIESIKGASAGVLGMVMLFPELPKFMASMRFDEKSDHPYAYYTECSTFGDRRNQGYTNYCPWIYKNNAALERQYNSDVACGYHPAGTTADSIGAHESAHALLVMIAQRYRANANGGTLSAASTARPLSERIALEVVSESVNELKREAAASGRPEMTSMEYRENLSRYAKKTTHETVAEAFADYYCNGLKSNPLTLKIVEKMKKLYQDAYNGGLHT